MVTWWAGPIWWCGFDLGLIRLLVVDWFGFDELVWFGGVGLIWDCCRLPRGCHRNAARKIGRCSLRKSCAETFKWILRNPHHKKDVPAIKWILIWPPIMVYLGLIWVCVGIFVGCRRAVDGGVWWLMLNMVIDWWIWRVWRWGWDDT